MSAKKFSNILLPRFRNREDALEFMRCIQSHTKMRPEIWIEPCIQIGDVVVTNPEYRDAPFECQYLL